MSVFTARYDLGIYNCYLNEAKRQPYLLLTHRQRYPLHTLCFSADRHSQLLYSIAQCISLPDKFKLFPALVLLWKQVPAVRPNLARFGNACWRGEICPEDSGLTDVSKNRSIFVVRVRFRGGYCFTLHMKALWSTETSVTVPVVTAPRPRKFESSFAPLWEP
jgi:hypothetical protein